MMSTETIQDQFEPFAESDVVFAADPDVALEKLKDAVKDDQHIGFVEYWFGHYVVLGSVADRGCDFLG
jgi:hypothetical protein